MKIRVRIYDQYNVRGIKGEPEKVKVLEIPLTEEQSSLIKERIMSHVSSGIPYSNLHIRCDIQWDNQFVPDKMSGPSAWRLLFFLGLVKEEPSPLKSSRIGKWLKWLFSF
jgi:hypothetical protein